MSRPKHLRRSSQLDKERCSRCGRIQFRPGMECGRCHVRRLLPQERDPHSDIYRETVACLATVRLIAECAQANADLELVAIGIEATSTTTLMLDLAKTRLALQQVIRRMRQLILEGQRFPLIRSQPVVEALITCRDAWDADGHSQLAYEMDSAFYAYGIPT